MLLWIERFGADSQRLVKPVPSWTTKLPSPPNMLEVTYQGFSQSDPSGQRHRP